MPNALQFICKNCRQLSSVLTFEQTSDGLPYCRCEHCGTKNKTVQTGASPSQPGLLPITGVIR